jgi:hypothetical protein
MKTAMFLAYQQKKEPSMTLITTPSVSERLRKLLTNLGYDLYSAAKKTGAELLRLPGFGRAALRETRAASPHIYYIQALTPEHVRGCILVMNLDEVDDLPHVISLLSAARGFALLVEGQIGPVRYLRDDA